MIALTIFTPTFNRAYTLNKCYKSLCMQTNQNFEWLIVDDGSTDNTEQLVKKWIHENKIKIRYIKQKNTGKMTAHNTGVKNTNTELFMCVDSDDYLTENAVEQLLNTWNNINSEKLSGIVALKKRTNGSIVGGNSLPEKIVSVQLNKLYTQYHFKGDTALCFRTEYLKKYLFPEICGEKFIPETYVYIQIDQEAPLYILNTAIYVCEYLDDGYTHNAKKNISKNPKGYKLYAEMMFKYATNSKEKITASAKILLSNWLLDYKNCFYKVPSLKWAAFSFPLALAFYIKNYKMKGIK